MLLLVLPIFCLALFVSEAPAPGTIGMTIDKFCTNASEPGQPIEFSAVITNTGQQDIRITGCTDDPPGSTIDTTFPVDIVAGLTATITGRYTPTTSPLSTDTITCTGYGLISGPTIPVTASDSATCTNPTGEGCTRTPGYWKNHPDAWPVGEILIGGVLYTKAGAIAKMEMPVRGDKRITMFKALVAARLNVLSEADGSCISGTISAADAWMVTYGGSRVPADSDAWKIGEPLYLMLDNYNNGLLCTPHCD